MTYVGVWAQPQASFAKWKAEGIQVIVGPDRESNKYTPQQVRASVRQAGLLYMDSPTDLNDMEALIQDPSCLMLMLPDESDLHVPPYNSDPAGFQKYVDEFTGKWKPFLDSCHGRKKWFANFAGPKVTGGLPAYLGQNQKPFAAFADVLCHDWYPLNMNAARYGALNLQVVATQALKRWFNKPCWSYIEVCDQNLDKTSDPADPKNIGRGPTPDEIQSQVDKLLAEGVDGILYFAHRIGGGLPWDPAGAAGKTAWDGRTPEQAAKCKEIALKLNPIVVAPDPLQVKLDAMAARIDALEKKIPKGIQLTF